MTLHFIRKSIPHTFITLFILLHLFIVSPLIGQTFRVPENPSKGHYNIDASINCEKGLIKGRESIQWTNNTDQTMEVFALDWSLSERLSMEIKIEGEIPVLLNMSRNGFAASPLFYKLPKPLKPGQEIRLDIDFTQTLELSEEHTEFGRTKWYPRLWWDGLPVHDAFSVKLDIPGGYALAISGRLNEKTGRYEIDGAKSFGIYLGRGQRTVTREVEGVQITTLSTEKGAPCAAVCMETALDAVSYYKEWLGFYPFDCLYIIPGGSGRWGGYPFATGIVVIHGQETYREGESRVHWQRITAHEIGHEYWGEWVLDPDDPAWVWIGMGIFADTEYILDRKIDPTRRQGWMSNYLDGLSMYNNTTVDIPANIEDAIDYDRNNVVIHSKGYSIVSALDVVLGRKTFERIYKKCLKTFGGRRLGWRDLQHFFESETGQNLSWFFDQWVRSNTYLCYRVESKESKRQKSGFLSTITIKQLGSMTMPVPVKAIFEDGTEQVQHTRRGIEMNVLSFKSKARLKETVLNPEHKLAMLEEPLPEISEEAADVLAWGYGSEESERVYAAIKEENIPNSNLWYWLGTYLYGGEQYDEAFACFQKVADLHEDGNMKFAALGWQGLLKDLQGQREKALEYYRGALKYDVGRSVRHSWLRIHMNRDWVDERLKTPFTQETSVKIPVQPTVQQLVDIVNDLNWQWEGKTPLLIYKKAEKLNVDEMRFWFKLGMLLFDSGYYPESFTAFTYVPELASTNLYRFAGYTWMGHLKDLLKQRDEAMEYYREALKYESGDSMTHSQFRMRINRKWVEKRLQTPFTWKK